MADCAVCDGDRAGYMRHMRLIRKLGRAEAGGPCRASQTAQAKYVAEHRAKVKS